MLQPFKGVGTYAIQERPSPKLGLKLAPFGPVILFCFHLDIRCCDDMLTYCEGFE